MEEKDKKLTPLNIGWLSNQKTSTYYKEGKKHKKELFLKLNIMEYKGQSLTMLSLFTHIGEAKIFEYILMEVHNSLDKVYLHDKRNSDKIFEALSIAPSTQHKYIKMLLSSQLLEKTKDRGYYTIGKKYIS